MILVTFGTGPYPFDRAVRWIENLCSLGLCSGEPILVQYGSSESAESLVRFPNVSVTVSMKANEFAQTVRQSRVVISHAGQGSTFMLAKQGVPFAILPRLVRYGEHVDDHQLGFAQSIEKYGVRVCLEPEQLFDVLTSPPELVPQSLLTGPRLVDDLIRAFP